MVGVRGLALVRMDRLTASASEPPKFSRDMPQACQASRRIRIVILMSHLTPFHSSFLYIRHQVVIFEFHFVLEPISCRGLQDEERFEPNLKKLCQYTSLGRVQGTRTLNCPL